MFIALQLRVHLNQERHFVLNTEERISITRLSSPHKGIRVKMLSGAAEAIFECLIPRAENLSTRLQMHFNCSNIYKVDIKDVFTGIQTQTRKQVPLTKAISTGG